MAGAEEVPVVPLSLQEWRETNARTTNLRAPWEPLVAWFESQGLTLFTTTFVHARAPNRVPRAPDGIGYGSQKGSIPWLYGHKRAIHCFARDSSGHDVLIRLIKKGDDGKEELDILQHVCTGHDAFFGENHCLPMLRLLSVGDMTFGVFPALVEGFTIPWFLYVGEILGAVSQLLEGLEYLHRNLIAHRDIGAENILINYIGGARPQTPENPFRRVNPIRYYYIDFELSVRFQPDSRPEDRVVSGIPILRRGYDHPDDYGRDLAPEIIGDNPHDPFKTDIYQLGMMFLENFKQLRETVPELIEMFDSMTRRDPLQRPAAHQLLEAVRTYKASLTREQLKQSAGPEPGIPGPSDSERDRRYKAMLERKAARLRAKGLGGTLKAGVLPSSPYEHGRSLAVNVPASALDSQFKIQSKREPSSVFHFRAMCSQDISATPVTPSSMRADVTSTAEDQEPTPTEGSFLGMRMINHYILSLVDSRVAPSLAVRCPALGSIDIYTLFDKGRSSFKTSARETTFGPLSCKQVTRANISARFSVATGLRTSVRLKIEKRQLQSLARPSESDNGNCSRP